MKAFGYWLSGFGLGFFLAALLGATVWGTLTGSALAAAGWMAFGAGLTIMATSHRLARPNDEREALRRAARDFETALQQAFRRSIRELVRPWERQASSR